MYRRRSIAALLAVALGLGAAAAGAGTRPQGPTDRSVKLDLIGKLKQGPGILILGDSRGRQAEPSLLQRLTGHTGFNAAVTGGSAPDAWVFTRYTADRFPGQKRRYIWFVSGGMTAYIADPRMKADPRGRHYLQEVAPYLSTRPSTPTLADLYALSPRWIARRRAGAPASPAQVKRVRAKAAQMVAERARPTRCAAPRPRALPAVRASPRLHERPRSAAGNRLQRHLPDRPGRAGEIWRSTSTSSLNYLDTPPVTLRLRRRQLPGHPQLGRQRLRLDERHARQPRKYAPHAPIHRHPRAGRSQLRGRRLAGTGGQDCGESVRGLPPAHHQLSTA